MSGGEDEQQQQKERQASLLPVGSSDSASTSMASGGGGGRATPEMKRTTVRNLIERYFHQLQTGCGKENCTNVNCASSGQVPSMTPNEVAARALQLLSQEAQLCDNVTPTATSPSTSSSLPVSVTQRQSDADMMSPNDSSSSSSTSTITSASTATTTSTQPGVGGSGSGDNASRDPGSSPFLTRLQAKFPEAFKVSGAATSSSSRASTPTLPHVESLDAATVVKLYAECLATGNYDRLNHAINNVFSCVTRLGKSFWVPTEAVPAPPATKDSNNSSNKLQTLLAKAHILNKEELRTLEGEHDKDEDSTQVQPNTDNDDTAGAVGIDLKVTTSRSDWCLLPYAVNLSNDETVAAAATGPSPTVNTQDDDEPMPMEQRLPHRKGSKIEPEPAVSSETHVDFAGLRRVKKLLFNATDGNIADKLIKSVMHLASSIRYAHTTLWEPVLHCLVICFDLVTNSNNTMADMEYVDRVLPMLCHATAVLPYNAQARLASIWAIHCSDQLQPLVAACQQQITLQVLFDEEAVRSNDAIISVTKMLKIVFYANILASELERPTSKLPSADSDSDDDVLSDNNAVEEDLFIYSSVSPPHLAKFAEDKLEKILEVSSSDCRNPLVPLEDFYNEALSDNIQMHHDYASYKTLASQSDSGSSHTQTFSFMLYAFILTPATKVDALYYDSRMRMYNERYSSLYSLIQNFGDGQDVQPRPDLKLTVRRDQLINDALIGLEMVAMSNPKDLKKQLVVEFLGEQGIDEGGVSKEFFQLIVEEIFNPAFGMFVLQEETNNMWFNATPFENGAQFTLIGIIIGLAIYNNVILAVNFPMVVYRKLMGYRGTLSDLIDWSPMLYKSLKAILEYDGPDMEEVFSQTFKISYSNMFGEIVEHDLLPNAEEVLVGQHNKRQFVHLYSDFLLNENVKQQFNAFRKGFEMVTDESPLRLLFRPEEIEMLVCGSRKFDFVELQNSTEYEGGYTEESQIIQDFWSIVHAMPNESKRKLLEFTTGSARVPVGGLKCLRLLITRHGPDSDRLPTSHTCFNVLLLPEYSSKEKLEERLLKAINYSKGFGML